MERFISKFFALCLSLILLLVTFSGCGQSNESKTNDQNTSNVAVNSTSVAAANTAPVEKTKISIMVWGTTERTKAAIDGAFAASPELKDKTDVEVVVGGPGDPEVSNKFRLSLASNTYIADAILLGGMQIPEFAEAGAIEDLTSVFDPYKDKVLPSAVTVGSYKGKVVSFPYELKPKLWFYRKDMFDAAGIDATSVKTVDQFIDAGNKLHAKFPKSYIWNLGATTEEYNLMMILSGNGARFCDENGEYVVDTDPQIRKAFETLKKIKDSKVTIQLADWSPDWEKGFADGILASVPSASWFKSYGAKYAAGQEGKWAVTQWPEFAESIGGSDTGGSMFVIPVSAKNKQGAIDFLTQFRLDTKCSLGVFQSSAKIMPITIEALKDPIVTKPDAFWGATLPVEEANALGKIKIFPYTPSSSQETGIVLQYLDKYITGTVDLDTALKGAEGDLKNQIGNPFKK